MTGSEVERRGDVTVPEVVQDGGLRPPAHEEHADACWCLEADQVVEHFRVIRPIGRGGMAEVYLARDTRLGRRVALKVVQPRMLGSAQEVERFLFEARTTARFSHPHIVAIHAVGEDEGRPYVALEYLEGESLRQRMQRRRPGMPEAMRIGRAVAQALAEAHGSGVLHRDLKPENVMLPRDGRPRVVDFGLARPIERVDGARLPGTPAGRERTEDDGRLPERFASEGTRLKGTPAYMAPEQWRLEPTSGATDVWALGVVLFELVVGRRPYRATSAASLALQVCDPEPAPPVEPGADVPAALAELIGRCLDKEPSNRPSAPEAAAELDALLSRGDAAPGEACPFRGLRPFHERHARLYFGREAEVSAAVERLREEVLLAVVGPSGSGKSSFARAGVIPRLREQGPQVVLTLRPGSRPFETLCGQIVAARRQLLSRATPSHTSTPSLELRRDDPELGELVAQLRAEPSMLALVLDTLAAQRRSSVVLLVDQLEELFTLVDDEETQRRFVDAVCNAADDAGSPVRAIFTLREEFLHRLADRADGRTGLRGLTLLRRPDAQMLRRILELQAEAAGHQFESPGLVEQLVADVRDEASSLPLLQFAAQQLWAGRDRERLRLTGAAYAQMGGVAGALARHADSVLARLTAEQERQARRILLRLVTAEGTRRVLRRAAVLEGLGAEAGGSVLERLVEGRLLTVRRRREEQEAELELVHESLIASWGRLGQWLDESRDERRFLGEAEQAAALWARRGRRDAEVWRGPALAEALGRAGRCERVPGLVQAFLAAGASLQQRAQRRRKRITAAIVAVLSLVTLAAVGVALLVNQQRSQLTREQRRGEKKRSEALLAGSVSALAQGDVLEARARLRGALELRDTLEARAGWWRLRRQPLRWRHEQGSQVFSVAFSPDGQQVVAGGVRVLYLYDRHTARPRVLRGHSGVVTGIAFSPDGRLLVTVDDEGGMRLWKRPFSRSRALIDPARYAALVRGRLMITSVAFAPGGNTVTSAHMDGTVRHWDVRSGRPLGVLRAHEGRAGRVAYSRDGLLASAGWDDGAVRLWDAATGRQKAALNAGDGGEPSRIADFAFSPDGTLLAAVGRRSVSVWDVSRAARRHLITLSSAAGAVAFTSSGRRLVTGHKDGSLHVLELPSGRRVGRLAAHGVDVKQLAASPDGEELASASLDGSVKLWRLGGWRQPRASSGHGLTVYGVAFGARGRRIVSGSADGTLRIWDVRTGAQRSVVRGPEGARILGVATSPDGKLAATCDESTVRLWSLERGEQLALFRGGRNHLMVAFNPGGEEVAVSSASSVLLLDAGDLTLSKVLRGRGGNFFYGLAYDAGGERLAAASMDGEIAVWDVRSGARTATLEGGFGPQNSVAFVPGRRQLLATGERGAVVQWDLATGRSRVLARVPGEAWWLTLSPDGELVALSAVSEKTCWVLDRATGRRTVLRGHRGGAYWPVFSPDGRLLATGGVDGKVRLWNPRSGLPVWRAPLLRQASTELYTHNGWTRLDGARVSSSGAAWRRAVERAHAASKLPDESLLCLSTGDALETWDPGTDRRLSHTPLAGLEQVQAVPGGCLTLAQQTLRRHDRLGASRVVHRDAAAVSWSRGELLVVASDGRVVAYGSDGVRRATHRADVHATAVARVGPWIVVGYQDGNMELLPTRPGAKRPTFPFEQVPVHPVMRIIPGPGGTVIAGHANGALGLWSADSGARLLHARLHGALVHLVRKGSRLYAATELGQHLTWDLSVFEMEYCGLLRQVWQEVPLLLRGGAPVRAGRPAAHRCAR